YSGYAADITRTLPANGRFTPRQREIYEIVLGAQNAALAALKPGADMCAKGKQSLGKIAHDYINSHGKDQHGKPLGQYFIHGLGHNIGLNVHDPGDGCKPLKPGQVVTVEPGIYIPEENLGVRIEDDVLITESGYELLSSKLPRGSEEIEKIMAEGGGGKKRKEIERRERQRRGAGARGVCYWIKSGHDGNEQRQNGKRGIGGSGRRGGAGWGGVGEKPCGSRVFAALWVNFLPR